MSVGEIHRPCNYPGCRNYAEHRGYCAEHYDIIKKRKQNSCKHTRYTGAVSYRTARWNRARVAYLSEHPVCIKCGAPATEVDHIIPHCGDYNLFWDVNNWQSLCHSCHSRKTVLEDGGFGHKRNKNYS